MPASIRVLAINTGSSSLKAALYAVSDRESLILSAHVERIGSPESSMRLADADNTILFERQNVAQDQHGALSALFAWLADNDFDRDLSVVGHRVVYGGRHYSEPAVVDAGMVGVLKEMIPLDPAHLPQAIDAIQFVTDRDPSLLQVACFDTAFHRHLPMVAQRYPLPRRFHDEGILRFGFHGLSYEYIVSALRGLESAAADGRLIVAHLGSGASMAAIRGGKSVDTSMGFTPVSGLMMGTRSGDVDPGVVLHLLANKGLTVREVEALINKESGLLGVSGVSADMRELVKAQSGDPRAREAIDLFCYTARKYLGAYVAALGGLDTLVFTGGIGEHAGEVREHICAGLECFGILLDAPANRADASVISTPCSRVKVRVMRTDEALMVARHASRLSKQYRR